MSTRRRGGDADDDRETSIYDPRERARRPTARGLAPQRAASIQRVEIATPTEVDAVVQRTPHERSEPIRVISMKATEDGGRQQKRIPAPRQVVLRSLSESSLRPPAGPVERIAPPHDPREARARRLRDYVMWSSAVVIVGAIVMLAVWFLAR